MVSKDLTEAFQKREGRNDRESFLLVVEAFLQAISKNDSFVVPAHTNIESGDKGNIQPAFLTRDGKTHMLMILSDPMFMIYYPDMTGYTTIEAKSVIRMLKKNQSVSGLLINSFSDSYCFLPKESIFNALNAMGVDYLN